jgi:hypothetical protein
LPEIVFTFPQNPLFPVNFYIRAFETANGTSRGKFVLFGHIQNYVQQPPVNKTEIVYVLDILPCPKVIENIVIICAVSLFIFVSLARENPARVYNVIALFPQINHLADKFGRVLQIAIQDNYGIAFCLGNPANTAAPVRNSLKGKLY